MPYQKHSTTTEENTQGTGSQDDWKKEVVPRLPAQLEEQAKTLKAFERCREISSATDLLRGLLASAFLSAFEYVERFNRLGRCVG